jgi:hypothetical protein
MLDAVEKFREVNINAKLMALPDDLLNPFRSSMGGSTGAKAEARFGESRIEDRRQDLADGLLDEPVEHVWPFFS